MKYQKIRKNVNKIKSWITILLILLPIVLVIVSFKSWYHKKSTLFKNKDPIYKSKNSDTAIYSVEGILNYRIIAQNIEYFSEKGFSQFTRPLLIIYNNQSPIWSIKADQAKLTENNILYLYNHIMIDSFLATSQVRKITTDSMQVNLVTQDIISQKLVKLYGKKFIARGSRMIGNLRRKKTTLIGKVKTNILCN